MTFDQLYDNYIKNSSVSKLQAQFIWNAAIHEALLRQHLSQLDELHQSTSAYSQEVLSDLITR